MRLATYLKYLVTNKTYRLIDLSKLSGVYLSELSRIVNGHRQCGLGTLEKLLKALREEHRAEFLMLWLQDQIPTAYKELLQIVPANRTHRSEETIDVGTFEGAMEFLSILSGRNESVRSLLMFLAAHHKPSAPTP